MARPDGITAGQTLASPYHKRDAAGAYTVSTATEGQRVTVADKGGSLHSMPNDLYVESTSAADWQDIVDGQTVISAGTHDSFITSAGQVDTDEDGDPTQKITSHLLTEPKQSFRIVGNFSVNTLTLDFSGAATGSGQYTDRTVTGSWPLTLDQPDTDILFILQADTWRLERDTGGGNEVVSGSLVSTDLVLVKSNGGTVVIDATAMIADLRLSSGVYNAATKEIDFTLSDNSVISVPVSALLSVDAALEIGTAASFTIGDGLNGKTWFAAGASNQVATLDITAYEDNETVTITKGFSGTGGNLTVNSNEIRNAEDVDTSLVIERGQTAILKRINANFWHVVSLYPASDTSEIYDLFTRAAPQFTVDLSQGVAANGEEVAVLEDTGTGIGLYRFTDTIAPGTDAIIKFRVNNIDTAHTHRLSVRRNGSGAGSGGNSDVHINMNDGTTALSSGGGGTFPTILSESVIGSVGEYVVKFPSKSGTQSVIFYVAGGASGTTAYDAATTGVTEISQLDFNHNPQPLASDITQQFRAWTPLNNAPLPVDFVHEGSVLAELCDNLTGAYGAYSLASQVPVVGEKQYVRIVWQPDSAFTNYACLRAQKSGTVIDTLFNVETGGIIENNPGQTFVVKNELQSDGLYETIIQYNTTVTALTDWVVFPAYSANTTTNAQAGATGCWRIKSLDLDYDYVVPDAYHAIFTKEGPSATTITSNVNGVNSIYKDLLNSTDLGDGVLRLIAGTNNNYNSHAITADKASKCKDYIEFTVSKTPEFHTETVAISNTNNKNAHSDQGDLRFVFTLVAHSIYDVDNVLVWSGSNAASTYRVTKEIGGFVVTRDGEVIYREPCVDQYLHLEEFYVAAAFRQSTTPTTLSVTADGQLVEWGNIVSAEVTDSANVLTHSGGNANWNAGATSTAKKFQNISATLDKVPPSATDGRFMWGFDRVDTVAPASATFQGLDYAFYVIETIYRIYENGDLILDTTVAPAAGDVMSFVFDEDTKSVEYWIDQTASGGSAVLLYTSQQPIQVILEGGLQEASDRIKKLEDPATRTANTAFPTGEVDAFGNTVMGMYIELAMADHTGVTTLSQAVTTGGTPVYVTKILTGYAENGTNTYHIPTSTDGYALGINGETSHEDLEMDHYNLSATNFEMSYDGNWSGYTLRGYVEYAVA